MPANHRVVRSIEDCGMKIDNGKTAFITGGAAGIGLSIAKALAVRGANIMLADLDSARLQDAAAIISALGAEVDITLCDVADEAMVRASAEATIERFGKVHIVANNAGVATGGMAGSTPIRDWRWVVDINLMGVVHGTEIFMPLIRSHGEGGHILNTASMAGHVASKGMSPYHATKFAVVGYSEALHAELADSNVGVSVLCPAWVKTGIHTSAFSRPSGGGTADDAQFKQMAAVIDAGLDSDIVGEWTVKCIVDGRFYIFTHPAFAVFITQRHESIMADYAACAAYPAFAKS
jgi:NAD(P)-dependent dehydrogenase (short-subunit alcohol dehydrogenase family)